MQLQEPWTKDAVKDILRRGRFYLGFVVEKRGLDERPGHHEAIIDEATYNAGLIGARTRFHPGQRPKAHRFYLLRRVISCENGHPMHGECPRIPGRGVAVLRLPRCRVPSLPADDAERVVVEAIRTMTAAAEGHR